MNNNLERPDKDLYFLRMARLAGSRSTCLRRAVGCVLVNARGHVLSTGYNGTAAGQPHCNAKHVERTMVNAIEEATPIFINRSPTYPNACAGATAESGTQLDACDAIHAEQNALLQCHDVYAIETCYVTASPCVTCLKLLLNTSCHRIVAASRYATATHLDHAAKLWMAAGHVLDLDERQ